MSFLIYTCTAAPAGGLADRLKGLLSCYGLALHLNRKFIVNWTFPHKLTDVVQPGQIDWAPRPIQGTYKDFFLIDNENFRQLQPILENKQLDKVFTHDIVSIRTNINFLNYFNLSFAETFNKLFKFDRKQLHSSNNYREFERFHMFR